MERIKISFKNLPRIIEKVENLIKKGGVIVCPTDTVYGLIADAKNKKAVKKIFKIKKRKEEKPIPIFVRDLKMAKSLVLINKFQEKLLKKVWPGKVTVLLKAKKLTKKIFPKSIISSENKIGLRTPNYKIINRLLRILNRPLTGTSANISGKPPSTKIKEILKQFKNQKYKPDLILDAGNLKLSLSSTIIDLENFKIFREGKISKEKIFQILARIKK